MTPLSARPLLMVLLACAGLLALTILIHDLFDVSFTIATVMVLPVFSLLWMAIERSETPLGLRAEFGAILAGVASMRVEAAILLASSVLGAALSLVIRELPAWEAMQTAGLPALAVMLICLAIVPVAGIACIPHTVLVVLLAQLFGSGAVAEANPMGLALSLTLGWGLGIALSPISATTLLTSRVCGARPHVVGPVWNGPFALIVFLLASVILVAIHALGL